MKPHLKSFQRFTALWITTLFLTLSLLSSLALAQQRPKLVLVMVIDQFRADYLTRMKGKFLPAYLKDKKTVGGLGYLMAESAYYPQAQYSILQCMTAPGHATILSGSYPYRAGIPMNNWYSLEENKVIHSTDDKSYPWVGTFDFSTTKGSSPQKNFYSTTVGDELKNADIPSRVVSISLKDRAAVLLGGQRADTALWFDTRSRQWISSKYYWTDGKAPEWVNSLNQRVRSQFKPDDDLSALIATEIGPDMTVAAAEHALETLQLGQKSSVDLLAVSFSSHDIVGHNHGPNSPEIEKITIAEDQAISHLLNTVQAKVPGGLKNVLIVLTADHGVSPSPDWLKSRKILSGRLEEVEMQQKVSAHLNERFGKPTEGDWITFVIDFNLYINRAALKSKKLESRTVEAEIRSFLLQMPEADEVITATEIRERKFPPSILGEQIAKTYYPGRSGDVIFIPKPFYLAGKGDAKPGSTSHLTGYSYDRTVPILLSGFHIRKGVYSRQVEVVDLAPTLSFILGTVPPSLSEGKPLSEAIQTQGLF